MGYLKPSNDLFLESIELQKMKEFLDDLGFRKFLQDGSASYGFIKHPNAALTGCAVASDVGNTIQIAPGQLIDSNGNVINVPQLHTIAIPADSNWYWLQLSYQSLSTEFGTDNNPVLVSIDTSGNLVCTSANAQFTQLLRGQPNFPSRIRFVNASYNILWYDIEEVIDDNHATLTGDFTVAETNLNISVVGTFTPGYVPVSGEIDVFQYDNYVLTLVQSNTTSEPAHTVGLQFFAARVKNNGSSILIEDRRNDFWTTNSQYYSQYLSLIANPIIGIDQITFDDSLSPQNENVLTMCWGFRGKTFAVNLIGNTITISHGSGGLLKESNFASAFINGDFNGWRCYTNDGRFWNIQTSIVSGGAIVLAFDNLNARSFFSDVNSTVSIVQELVIVPPAEEIEIICTPNNDVSEDSQNEIVEKRIVFPINELYGKIKLEVYDPTNALYVITYRYKNLLSYSQVFTIPNDSVGYYNEDQFNSNGTLIPSPSRTSYSAGSITLIMSSNSYSNEIARIDLGDIKGVDVVVLTNTVPLVNVIVGASKQYQLYLGTSLTLSADMYINLKELKFNGNVVEDGNQFSLHFKQPIVLNGHNLYITYGNSATPSSNTKIKTFTQNDVYMISTGEQGLFFLCTYSFEESAWLINNTNEANRNYKTSLPIVATNIVQGAGAVSILTAPFEALPVASQNMTVLINVQHTPNNGYNVTVNYCIYVNGVQVYVISDTWLFANNTSNIVTVMKSLSGLNKGDIIDIRMSASGSGSGNATVVGGGEANIWCIDGDIN